MAAVVRFDEFLFLGHEEGVKRVSDERERRETRNYSRVEALATKDSSPRGRRASSRLARLFGDRPKEVARTRKFYRRVATTATRLDCCNRILLLNESLARR